MAVGADLRVAIDVRCDVGECPIWHPERETLLWVDIYAQVLYEAKADGSALRSWGFGEQISVVALIDGSSAAVTSAAGLQRINLDSGERSLIAALEGESPRNRTSDGRVGPGGVLWMSTLADSPLIEGAGSIYRYVGGGFERVLGGVSIPNSIAFSPDGTRAYFADTWDHRIRFYNLDPETGAPRGEPELFVDLSEEGFYPDGSVVDAEGCLWTAIFGGGRVVRYRPDGALDQVVEFPVTEPSCPGFGGPDLKTMYVTTAWALLSPEERAKQPLAGAVFAFELDTPGLPERRMRLPENA